MVEYDGLCCMIEITVGSKVTYEDGRIGTVEPIEDNHVCYSC
jgi:uncharacterized protein YkvS